MAISWRKLIVCEADTYRQQYKWCKHVKGKLVFFFGFVRMTRPIPGGKEAGILGWNPLRGALEIAESLYYSGFERWVARKTFQGRFSFGVENTRDL